MFVIKPDNHKEWQHAMFILSYYRDLHCELFSDGENAESAYMVVDSHPQGFEFPKGMDNTADNNLRYAEMAFQMEWRQGGMVCHHCEISGEDGCGHLTFVSRIDSSAFDKAMGFGKGFGIS